MAEFFRIIPEGTDRPAAEVWTSREALDKAMHQFAALVLDKRQPTVMREAAKRLVRGRLQTVESVEWVDVQ